MEIFNSKEYKCSRRAYVGQCTFEYFIGILITDAFLAKLLTNIGISDSLVGIISSISSFAFLFQTLSIVLVNKMKNVKKTVAFFETLSFFLFMGIYTIPFLKISLTAKTIIIISAILISYLTKYMVSSVIFKWANSYVMPQKRGSFSAAKEMISLFTGMIFSLFVGFVIDKYESIGNINGGFLFIAISILILNICNLCSILMIKNSTDITDNNSIPIKKILKNTVGNKKFFSIIVLTAMWDIARYMTIGFMGTFKINDLLISVGTVQIINMVANGVRLGLSLPLGRFSDKFSFAKGFELALSIAATGFFINIFTGKSTWWFVIIFSILYSASLSGTNANTHNIIYSYVENKYVIQAMTIRNCIGGILGFASSMAGSYILSIVQANNNIIFGVHIYGQQILSSISFIIILFAIIYDRVVVEKHHCIIQ